MSIDLSTIPWAPTLAKVGAHIQSRTRHVETNIALGTFTANTYPTDVQVSEVIRSAVSMVQGKVGTPIVAAAYDLCETAAALWSAYWTELTFPERDSDVTVYLQLRADALLLMEQAEAVNIGAGGGTQDPPDEDGLANNELSSYYFPAAPGEYVL